MTLKKESSDTAVLKEIGHRIDKFRLNQNKTQEALALESGISKRTLIRVESGHSVQLSSLIRILRELDLLENLETLIPEPALSPIQQLKMKGKQRQRASKKSSTPKRGESWSWGDEA